MKCILNISKDYEDEIFFLRNATPHFAQKSLRYNLPTTYEFSGKLKNINFAKRYFKKLENSQFTVNLIILEGPNNKYC